MSISINNFHSLLYENFITFLFPIYSHRNSIQYYSIFFLKIKSGFIFHSLLFFIFLLHAFCPLSLISPICLIMLFLGRIFEVFSLPRYSFIFTFRCSNSSYCADNELCFLIISSCLACNSLEC